MDSRDEEYRRLAEREAEWRRQEDHRRDLKRLEQERAANERARKASEEKARRKASEKAEKKTKERAEKLLKKDRESKDRKRGRNSSKQETKRSGAGGVYLLSAIVVGGIFVFMIDESSNPQQRDLTLDKLIKSDDAINSQRQAVNEVSTQNYQQGPSMSDLMSAYALPRPPQPAKTYAEWPFPSSYSHNGPYEFFEAGGSNDGGLSGEQPTIFFRTSNLIDKRDFKSAIFFAETKALGFLGQDGVLRIPMETYIDVFDHSYSEQPSVSVSSPNEEYFSIPLEVIR